MTQQELATSSHRLSRVPQKLRPKPETSESYAVGYFQTHSDLLIDKRTPADKLEEVDIQLVQDIKEEDRFHLLIRRKSLCYLVYGETSAESLESVRQLAEFYIEQQRWESALRHLTKAQEMSQSIQLSDIDTLALAVDVAETYLSLPTIPRQQLNRQLTASESVLTRYTDIQTGDQRLAYRRDLTLARINVRRGHATEAMAQYTKALEELDDFNDGEVTHNSAELCREMAEAAEAANDSQTALRMYKRAQAAYRELGMHETAKLLERKINPDLKTDSDDERQQPTRTKDLDSASLGAEEEDSPNE